MYLIASAPRVFNIKWDRDHTRSPRGLPMQAAAAAVAPAPAALAVSPKVSYRASSGLPFTRPTNPFACLGCNCSGRGIGTPPQKKMGSNLRGLYGLRGATYNSATNYIYSAEPASQVQPVAQAMIAEGYNANIVNTLVAAGASAEDLQNLWDNYTNSSNANDPDGFGAPALQLLNQIYAVHPQGAGKPMPPSLTYGQALALTPSTIATAASNAASGVAMDVANLFKPSGAPSTGVPWYWWLIGGGIALEVARRVL